MILLVFLVWFGVCIYICCNVPLLPSVHVCAYVWIIVFVFIFIRTTPLEVFFVYLLFFVLPMWLLHRLAMDMI
uniref:E5 n=1 Tax=Human papillomavirus 39 TaxID=10588 RepID=T2A6J5_HPV39|nr:E5 [human papillomavirus 39]AGU90467.1 E5 [human papillomavirus 39]